MFLSIRLSRKGISREAAEAGEAVTAEEEAMAVIMAAAATAGSRKRIKKKTKSPPHDGMEGLFIF